MKFPLALENCENSAKYAGVFLCAALFAFAMFCRVFALEEDVTTSSTRDFYPYTLDRPLRRIVDSRAIEVQSFRKTGTDILDCLNRIVIHLEYNPTEPCSELQRLEQAVKNWDMIRKSWTIKVSVNSTVSNDELPYIPSATVLEEISLALQRRIYVWRLLLTAESVEASPITTLYDKNHSDIDRLKERTLAVEQYFTKPKRTADRPMGQTWCNYLETQSWLTELEACQQPNAMPIRRVSLSSPSIPVEILKTLCTRANTTLHRLESPTLTNEQRVFLNHPAVNTWKEELQHWTADTVTPISVLRLLEQYEATSGMSDMKALSQFADQLSISKTAEYRQLGENVRRQYGMANVKFLVSAALLNNHLPPPAHETASFREVIQDQPTVGHRQTDTELAVSFVPHPTRLLTSLDIGVDIATFSRSDVFASQLFNTGRTSVLAQKTIELTEKGFITEPCEARIGDHRMRLTKLETDFDSVPLLSRVFRNVVFDQYESRKPAAGAETRQKILRQVRNRIDKETEKKLQPINEKIKMLSQHAEKEFGLQVEKQGSRTEENWLLTAWGVRSTDALSANTPAPETLPGSFADLKVHESLLNMLIGQFEFEGKRGSVGEFKELLAEKLKQPSLAAPEENDDVEVTFAPYNPVIVRFMDGRIELMISIAALRVNRKTHRNFQVIVWYKPAYDSEGRLVLERDGYISLINVQAQIFMRTAFGKIFPINRPFPLVPKVLENDSQFDYLTTGHCRIEKGWFALALVEKAEKQ